MKDDLNTIETLFMAPYTLTLYGIPYRMRRDSGQTPRHLFDAGNTSDWIYLGEPGWWGTMDTDRMTEVKEYLATIPDAIPRGAYQWTDLPTHLAGHQYLTNLGSQVWDAFKLQTAETSYERFSREFDPLA
jgi:hypothetical protein